MNQIKKLPFVLGVLVLLASLSVMMAAYEKEASPSVTEEALPFGSGLGAEISGKTYSEESANAKYDNPEIALGKGYVVQQVVSVAKKEQYDFAGEVVPVDQPDVYERLDRELHSNTYWHSNTILLIKLSNKYFPEIERILEENGVPDDFKYLCVAESGLRNVISPARATGFWQFMKETAKKYDLIVTDEIDQRYDYILSTQAACDYLNDAYKKYNNWTLAAASYNMGMGGVSKALSEQSVESYYDLHLNSETARYIFRIVAIKEILSDPSAFGFTIPEDERYVPVEYTIHYTDKSIENLARFAKEQGTNYKMVKILNPWIRKNSVSNKEGNVLEIKIPK